MPLEFRPNFEKIVELLLYLACIKPGVDKYQVVKLFYLADREHLNRYGRPITQEKYVAMRYGPVASNVMDLLEGDNYTMRRAGIDALPVRTENVPVGDKIYTYIREPLRDVDLDIFSKSDIAVFDEIVAKFGDCNFDELFNLTHEHYAYRRAWGERRPNSFAEPMRYEEMIEDPEMRDRVMEDIAPIARYIE